MEIIFKSIVRHAVFVCVSFLSLYLVALTFTAPFNFLSWDIGARVLFSMSAHIIAAVMHAYWYDNK